MPAPPLPSARKVTLRPLRTDPASTRIFVCDDDLDFADELTCALGAGGFDVRTLRDGRTPVEVFELCRPDIVLLDIFMPPPDGFEMMNHICQDRRAGNLALILLSGAEGALLDVAAGFCRARGMLPAATLRKPVRLDGLLQVCRQLGGKHRAGAGGSVGN